MSRKSPGLFHQDDLVQESQNLLWGRPSFQILSYITHSITASAKRLPSINAVPASRPRLMALAYTLSKKC